MLVFLKAQMQAQKKETFTFFFIVGFACLLLNAAQLHAHEDMDLSIETIHFDHECLASVTIKNVGRPLPRSFYHAPAPATITINKGGVSEVLAPLSELDNNKRLKAPGGELTIRSKNAYSNMPEHVEVTLTTAGEYSDHGAKNNILRRSVDCVPNKGEIPGKAIAYLQPDIRVSQAEIDEQCHLKFRLENLTGAAMSDVAWGELGEGAEIRIVNIGNSELLKTVPFKDLDSNKRFSKSEQTLVGAFSLQPIKGHSIKVAAWFVPNDLDFQNNTQTVDVPKKCQDLN